MIPREYLEYIPDTKGELFDGKHIFSMQIQYLWYWLKNSGDLLTETTSICYSDSTANRLLPFKLTLDYLDTHNRVTYGTDCANGCGAINYAYGGVQLTEQRDKLECWCGDTQPLRWVSKTKAWTYSIFSSFLRTNDDDCNFQCINPPTTPCEKMNKMRVFTSLQNYVPFQQPPLCSHEWINKDDRYRNEFNIKPMIFNEKYIDRNVFHQLSSK